MFKPLRPSQMTESQKTILLANSITVTLGDAIGLLNGTIGVASNSDTAVVTSVPMILGVVNGFTDSLGQVLNNGADTSEATGTGANTYAQYISASQEFVADLSAVSGTTTNSNKKYVYFTLGAGHPERLLESSVAAAAPTTFTSNAGQFISFGVMDDNTSQVFGRFVSTFWN